MMDVREKLVELLSKKCMETCKQRKGYVCSVEECKHRYTENCPMYFHDSYWHEGYEEYVDDYTDHTEDDYFCPKGERKEGAE